MSACEDSRWTPLSTLVASMVIGVLKSAVAVVETGTLNGGLGGKAVLLLILAASTGVELPAPVLSLGC